MRIIKKQEIEELVDSGGGMIGGDRNVTNNSEIETGPVQKPWNDDSDYEKGVSTTTDRATRYRQNIPWFAVYSYRGAAGRIHEKTTKLTKKQLEEEIKEDLVKKSKRDVEVLDKNHNFKIEKMIDTIEDADLTKDQLEKIKKTILDKIDKSNG
jgi:hypothetical protein